MPIISSKLSPMMVWMVAAVVWIFLNVTATTHFVEAQDEEDMLDHDQEHMMMDEDFEGEEMLPDMLERDDIAYFFGLGIDELWDVLHFLFEQSQRIPSEDEEGGKTPEERDPLLNPLPPRLLDRGSGATYTTRPKLQLDLEQAQYLFETLEDETERQFFGDIAIPIYEAVLNNMPEMDYNHDGLYYFSHEDYKEHSIDLLYNKAWRPTLHESLVDDATDETKSLLNPLSLDAAQMEQAWNNGAGVVVFDNFLTDEALKKISEVMRQSTVWFEASNIGYASGAYLDDGLYDKILLQLAYQVHDALPRSILPEDLALHDMWARKYDDRAQTDETQKDGEGEHDDAHNVFVEVGDPYSNLHLHLWLSPNEAKEGQLAIFTAKPPRDWGYTLGPTGNEVMETIIEPSGYANVTIPFAKNRAVLFDAALFHQQTKFQLASNDAHTYKNRRTDLTLLYGVSAHHHSEDDEEFEEGEEL